MNELTLLSVLVISLWVKISISFVAEIEAAEYRKEVLQSWSVIEHNLVQIRKLLFEIKNSQ